jgi:hypothetical protein
MIRLFESFLSPWLKSPSIPLYERGMTMGSPLWKRGVRGDFVEIFNSIGVSLCSHQWEWYFAVLSHG